ncbi:MAG: ChbG/HpnK family deacetylase [Erysipelotrichaceae bacterium]|nr:ChbG/HpnK family deacetylase [Erysipelotrichaceae bacterium]
MKQLIIRADDIGYSEAVNYGILKTVKDGLVSSAGLMPNMPYAAHGLALLEGYDVAIGQHTNMCLEYPCADPELIPSLIDENGKLKSSKTYREAFRNGIDFVVFEEAVIEIEAQYQKFKELTGKEPSYFEAHAVISENLNKALAYVADKYGLRFQPLKLDGHSTFDGKPIQILPMESSKPDYDPFETLKRGILEVAREDMPNVFIGHPGYVDDYLMKNSSLNINRTKEAAMLCDPEVKKWLDEHDVELISYDDI